MNSEMIKMVKFELTYDGERDFSSQLVSLGGKALGRTFKHLDNDVDADANVDNHDDDVDADADSDADNDDDDSRLPIHDQLLRGSSAEEATM